MKLKNRIKVQRQATQNACELLAALTQLVKAKTELERTRGNRMALGGIPAVINRPFEPGGITSDFIRPDHPTHVADAMAYSFAAAFGNTSVKAIIQEHLMREEAINKIRRFGLSLNEVADNLGRMSAILAAMKPKESDFAKGTDSVKEAEPKQDTPSNYDPDRLRDNPQPIDAKKPQYTAPAMKRADNLEMNHTYLAVHKRAPMRQVHGEFDKYINPGKIELRWGAVTTQIMADDYYFFEYEAPKPIQ